MSEIVDSELAVLDADVFKFISKQKQLVEENRKRAERGVLEMINRLLEHGSIEASLYGDSVLCNDCYLYTAGFFGKGLYSRRYEN